jgi:hypothetical protein
MFLQNREGYQFYWRCECGNYMHDIFGKPTMCHECGRPHTKLTKVTARIVHEKAHWWSSETYRHEESPYQDEGV